MERNKEIVTEETVIKFVRETLNYIDDFDVNVLLDGDYVYSIWIYYREKILTTVVLDDLRFISKHYGLQIVGIHPTQEGMAEILLS